MRKKLHAESLIFSKEKETALFERFDDLSVIRSGTCLVAYMAIDYEPSLNLFLTKWLSSGKKLFLPRYEAASRAYSIVRIRNLEKDLRVGHYGILEPGADLTETIHKDDAEQKTLIWMIPGLAFGIHGERLGRGKGYYDRLLTMYPGVVKIGICLDCQLLESGIMMETHDIRMDIVITEKRECVCVSAK